MLFLMTAFQEKTANHGASMRALLALARIWLARGITGICALPERSLQSHARITGKNTACRQMLKLLWEICLYLAASQTGGKAALQIAILPKTREAANLQCRKTVNAAKIQDEVASGAL